MTFDEYERRMWEEADTPEAVLAAGLAELATTAPGGTRWPTGYTLPKVYRSYALTRVGGRTVRAGGADPAEARVKLRDKLVRLSRAAVR